MKRKFSLCEAICAFKSICMHVHVVYTLVIKPEATALAEIVNVL